MDAEPLLLQRPEHVVGFVDYLGRPVSRSSSGGWTSASFIIAVELAERFAYYGIALNLITYLTGPLHQSTASAAASVNFWSGVAYMLPLLGAFVADSYLGRYRTIVLASILYVLGLGMLTLSTVLPSLRPPECGGCKPDPFPVAFFYFCLYFFALAQGGHKACVQAFGADQFDQNDPQECNSRFSFFNWWNFGLYGGMLLANAVLSYIQDNISWTIGFGIPCIVLLFALGIFLLGTKTYRLYPIKDESPFARIAKTLLALPRNERRTLCTSSEDIETHQANSPHLLLSSNEDNYINNVEHAEEAEGLLQLLPIWASCLMFTVIIAQCATFFTKECSTLDRRIVWSFELPPAASQSFMYCSAFALIPVYDGVFMPIARSYTKLPSGITMLQRIGTGLVLSTIAMVIAALVEMKRLKTARDLELVDQPDVVIPMSFWWMVPQYFLLGASEVFTVVGMQEFFYDQVPDALRSLGLALYISIYGVGEFMSYALVSLIDGATRRKGESWFSDNLNKAHLDYFYWLLAGLSSLMLLLYLYLAQAYRYKSKNATEDTREYL